MTAALTHNPVPPALTPPSRGLNRFYIAIGCVSLAAGIWYFFFSVDPVEKAVSDLPMAAKKYCATAIPQLIKERDAAIAAKVNEGKLSGKQLIAERQDNDGGTARKYCLYAEVNKLQPGLAPSERPMRTSGDCHSPSGC